MAHLTIKTAPEIACMEKAGRIVGQTLHILKKYVKPGITTAELNEIAWENIKKNGATPSFLGYRGFPYAICASLNHQVVHGFPDKIKLKDGDILSIDVGAQLNGWHGDAARTFLVGNVSEPVKKLVEDTRQCFYEGLRYAKAGNYIKDISRAIEEYAKKRGYGVVRELTGHGIGRNLHEPPDVPNFVLREPGRGVRLEEGMTLAIEPMINMGTAHVHTLDDGWTVVTMDGLPSAHYENTIAITKDEPKLLTLYAGQENAEVTDDG